ncbi:MAG: MATE family efflux transporter, partial [Acidobacteriota bacterium]
LVQLGMMTMGTVDVMMLGRVSEQALAAGALGNSISFGALVFGMGVLFALDPLIAQAWGARNHVALARHLQRGMVLAVAMCVPMGIFLWDIRWLLELLRQDPSIREPAAAYIRAIIPGMPGFLLFVAARQTLQAMSRVRQALWAIFIANVVNAAANYALIFGNWGFPRLEVVGSAWSTTVSRWAMCIAVLTIAAPSLRPYLTGLRRSVLAPSSYGPLVRLGIPIGLQVSLEMSMFLSVTLMMGNLGARELAAHQIALVLAAMSFMVPLGISGAAAARVGNAIGRGDPVGARRSAVTALALGVCVMTVSAMAFWLFPSFLARLFTPEAAVVALAATLLPVAALFQIFDGLQVVSAGILRGAADTRLPAIIALIGFWGLGLPLAYALGIFLGWGPVGLWWGLTLGLASVAVLLVLRLRWVLRGDLAAYEAL